MAATSATAARDQRRLGREKRRDAAAGSGQPSTDSPTRHIPPRTTAVLGTAVGLLAGLLVGREAHKRGNEITGDVAVHLLNRIELLTIRLHARQARRGGPTQIDVHHVRADAASRR